MATSATNWTARKLQWTYPTGPSAVAPVISLNVPLNAARHALYFGLAFDGLDSGQFLLQIIAQRYGKTVFQLQENFFLGQSSAAYNGGVATEYAMPSFSTEAVAPLDTLNHINAAACPNSLETRFLGYVGGGATWPVIHRVTMIPWEFIGETDSVQLAVPYSHWTSPAVNTGGFFGAFLGVKSFTE